MKVLSLQMELLTNKVLFDSWLDKGLWIYIPLT